MFKPILTSLLATLIACNSASAFASTPVAELRMDLDKDGKADLIQIVDRKERYLRLEITTTKNKLRLSQSNLIRSNHQEFWNGDEKNMHELMEPALKEESNGLLTLEVTSFDNSRVSRSKSWMLELKGRSLLVKYYSNYVSKATGDEAWSEERDYDFDELISTERLNNWDGEGNTRGGGQPIDPSCQPKLSAFVLGKEPKCVGSIWN